MADTTNHKLSLPDTPYTDEKNDFGTEPYVNGLVKFIENSSTPITIAIQGEWGSGKTSLMNRLKNALCSNNKDSFIGVEINTWEYSMMNTPEVTVMRIIERLISELSSGEKNKEVISKWESIKRKGKHVYNLSREAIKAIGVLQSVAVELFTNAIETKQEEEEPDVTLSELKKALEDAVRSQTTNIKKGIIVFVDDLDRLNPPVAVEILELLKNIFCIENCIFVLAIDYDVVVKGLEPKFGELTPQNEREFRSFFDKIIQVPFSLPVNSYRPADFVLASLREIGYITAVEETNDDSIRKPLLEIVNRSVGKNPRSIKRLVNTLSLLLCISKCEEKKENKNDFPSTKEGRITTFAIVAIQVCYPRIYRMLSKMPNFTEWDRDLAKKFNISLSHSGNNKNESYDENMGKADWEEILDAACSADTYLTQHFDDIRSLLDTIKQNVEKNMKNTETFTDRIKSIMDKSSVTGIAEPQGTAEVDRKRLIHRLHENVSRRVREKRPEIPKMQWKRNTGNGGFYVFLPDRKNSLEVILRPIVAPDKIALELSLFTAIARPNELMGQTWEEMLRNEKVKSYIESFDSVVSPLLKETQYFEGSGSDNNGTYFKSFADEQAFRHENGLMPNHINSNVTYWINLKQEAHFEDRAIVETIANVITAAYDMKKAGKNLL